MHTAHKRTRNLVIKDFFLGHESDISLAWKNGSSSKCKIQVSDVIDGKNCAACSRNVLTAFKIKLGDDSLANNLEKIKILDQLTPQSSILRVDPNQSWSVDYTIKFLEAVESLAVDLEYLEQPIQREDLKGLALIRQNSSTAIMADEACFDLNDLNRIIDMGAADWVNIKILKSGGVTPAREMAAVALQNGLHLSFGCMIESPLGVRAAMELAHEFAPDETHDLDAAWWYLQEELKYEGGAVS